MNKAVLFLFLVLAVFEARATPRYRERYSLDEEDNNFTCFKVQCPSGTVACKRLQTTNKDGSKLVTEVECQDNQGSTLDTFTKEEVNPFDKSTKFTSYSFTGHYESGVGRRINHNDDLHSFSRFNNNHDSDVEVFK